MFKLGDRVKVNKAYIDNRCKMHDLNDLKDYLIKHDYKGTITEVLSKTLYKVDDYILNSDSLTLIEEYIEVCGEKLRPKIVSNCVNSPKHYTQGSFETIDYIKDKLTEEEFKGYIKGNVIKYISREAHKNGKEDMQKAEWYLHYLNTGEK